MLVLPLDLRLLVTLVGLELFEFLVDITEGLLGRDVLVDYLQVVLAIEEEP